jgi:hypothetical protein
MSKDLERRVQRLARAVLELTEAVTLLEQRERVLESDLRLIVPRKPRSLAVAAPDSSAVEVRRR